MIRLRARSLQSQLALRLAAVYVLATLVAVAILVFQAYSTADTLSDQDLARRAEDLAGFVKPGPGGEVRLELPPKLAAAYASDAETFLFAIRNRTGRLIAASHADIRDLVPRWPLATDEPSYFRLEDFGRTGQDYYGLSVLADSRAGPLSISVARAADATELVHAVLWEFVLDIAWIIPLVVAATLLIGVFGIRGGLAPLRQVSKAAAAIDAGSLSMRLPDAHLPGELQPLIGAVNSALDRLERGFAVQRQFTANAAHELRTPLAIVTAGLEQMEGNGELDKLRHDVARMNRLVEQLLRVARLDAVVLDVSGSVDLNSVVADVVEYMAPLAVAQRRALAAQPAEAAPAVRGNRSAIEDAVRNLVENALAHAPAGSEIVVAAHAPASISVTDRGPGVKPEDRPHIFERFWRTRDRHGPGAGLGLAIVREIMKAHRGRVELADAPGGGTVFTLAFPTETA